MSVNIVNDSNKAVKLFVPDDYSAPELPEKRRIVPDKRLFSEFDCCKNEFLSVSITKTTGRLIQDDSDSSITEKIVEEISGMQMNFHSIREIKGEDLVVSEGLSKFTPGSLNKRNSRTVHKSIQNFNQVEYQTIGQVENKDGERKYFETGIKLTGYQKTTMLKQYSEEDPLIIKADFYEEDAKDVAFLFDIKDENAVFPESGVGYIKWIDDLKEILSLESSSSSTEEVVSFGSYYENFFTSKFNSDEGVEERAFTSYRFNFSYSSQLEYVSRE